MKPVPLSEKASRYSFTKLRDLRPGTDVHFYGLVTRCKGPFQTRGTDYCMSLTVIDESLPRMAPVSGDSPPNAIPVVIFHRDLRRLPQVRGVGDVVQFRHFRIQPYNDTVQALSMRQTAWIVYTKDETGSWTAKPPHELGAAELDAIQNIHLQAATDKRDRSATAVYDSQDPVNRASLVCELKPGMLFDLTAQVFKKVSSNRTAQTVLLLTDYTENELLRWEGGEVPGHMAKRVLMVTFWDNFATLAGTLHEGDVVRCRNLSAKVVDHKLVASMHGDQSVSADVNIVVCGPDSVEADSVGRRKENVLRLVQNTNQHGSIDMTAVVKHQGVPSASIMTLLSAEAACGVACVVARAVKVKPRRRRRGVVAAGGHFLFQLVLQDDTGELDAIVCGEEGSKFFSCSPADYGAEQDKHLATLLSSLLPSPFLIKTYTTVQGRRRFQLFNTFLTV